MVRVKLLIMVVMVATVLGLGLLGTSEALSIDGLNVNNDIMATWADHTALRVERQAGSSSEESSATDEDSTSVESVESDERRGNGGRRGRGGRKKGKKGGRGKRTY
ncbi:hypothetical protein Pmani_002956 [Petrolisthes manimaculis]|uniref:Uncharacterized protein n=1 Tax=Petrolisthes manimaculis TaxID=1843537 RepID=A0AAE1QGV0_9EUCA|nr:hypothetical protein Pmani_002956 [Petrolisthes manimaculis]